MSDRGLRRHHNEDAWIVQDDLGFYMVADGMGGHAAGEVAAQLAVTEASRLVGATRTLSRDTWPGEWNPHLSPSGNRLVRAILAAHHKVTDAVDQAVELRGMGATVVAALVAGDLTASVAHVGDSRAYLFGRDAALRLLTSDHSWVHEQVVAGLLSEEAARSHPLKNVVTRALGGAQEPTVDVEEHLMRPGETLLLCSDGLNGMLEDEEISQLVATYSDLRRLGTELISAANRRGGVDNTTVILVRAAA